MVNKNILRVARIIVSVSIFIILYLHLNLKEVTSSIISIGILPILLFLVLFFIYTSTGAICLKIIVDSLSKPIKFFRIAQYYLMSWAIGQFTPSNVGEFSIILFLHKEKEIKTGKALAISVADKIITFALIFIVGTISMFFYFPVIQAGYLAGLIAIASLGLLFLIFNARVRNKIFIKIFKKGKHIIEEFDVELKKFFLHRKKAVFINFLITILRWSIFFISMKLLFQFMGVDVSIYHMSAILSINTIIAMLPISINGLGIREASGIYLFELIGVSSVIAGAAFGIMLLVRYIIAILILVSNKIGPEVFIKDLLDLKKKKE